MKNAIVFFTNDQKVVKIPAGAKFLLRRCCNAVLHNEGLEEKFEINITFVTDERIAELNKKFRDKDGVTDVLSFPLGCGGDYPNNPESGNKILGDVIISVQRALAQAEEYEHTLQRELGYLITHSVLHLLGYDHESDAKDAFLMREKEESVMELVGLTREEQTII